jgi:hypothetical protein
MPVTKNDVKSPRNYDTITNASSKLKEVNQLEAARQSGDPGEQLSCHSGASSFSADPEFEESLQLFVKRLDMIYKPLGMVAGFDQVGFPNARLIPNVSPDWIMAIKRKSLGTKSKSPIKSESL